MLTAFRMAAPPRLNQHPVPVGSGSGGSGPREEARTVLWDRPRAVLKTRPATPVLLSPLEEAPKATRPPSRRAPDNCFLLQKRSSRGRPALRERAAMSSKFKIQSLILLPSTLKLE